MRYNVFSIVYFQIISHDEDLDDIPEEDSDEDLHDDSALERVLESGTITAVFDVDPYLACPNKGCNNTKLITVQVGKKYMMKCKNCKGLYPLLTIMLGPLFFMNTKI